MKVFPHMPGLRIKEADERLGIHDDTLLRDILHVHHMLQRISHMSHARYSKQFSKPQQT